MTRPYSYPATDPPGQSPTPSSTTTGSTNPPGGLVGGSDGTSGGTFDPNSYANYLPPGTTDPGGTTGTDIYGLSPAQENWQIYTGGLRMKVVPAPSGGGFMPKPGGGRMETKTALELMRAFTQDASSADPGVRQSWANTQAELQAMGAYGSSKVRFGTWTPDDAKAILWAMHGYTQLHGPGGAGQPVTFSEYVGQQAQLAAAQGFGGSPAQGSGSGSSSSQPAALQTVLTNPADLRAAAQQAAQSALGRVLSAADLSKFVEHFHANEQQLQQSAYQSQLANTATTLTKGPTAGVAADEFVQSEHPQEFSNQQARDYTGAFLSMFLPNQAAPPPATPVVGA